MRIYHPDTVKQMVHKAFRHFKDEISDMPRDWDAETIVNDLGARHRDYLPLGDDGFYEELHATIKEFLANQILEVR